VHLAYWHAGAGVHRIERQRAGATAPQEQSRPRSRCVCGSIGDLPELRHPHASIGITDVQLQSVLERNYRGGGSHRFGNAERMSLDCVRFLRSAQFWLSHDLPAT
jgi:hypothetical protein